MSRRRRGAARPPARLDPALAQIVKAYAQLIAPDDRPAFLQAVERRLPPVKLRGPGSVMRVAAECQRAFLTAKPAEPAPARKMAAPLPLLGLGVLKLHRG